MSYRGAQSRGGPSTNGSGSGSGRGTGSGASRPAPRMPEDRDATVSHGTRRDGLGLPPLVLASSRGRGRGRGRGFGAGFALGRATGTGITPMAGRGTLRVSEANSLPARPGQGVDNGWSTHQQSPTVTSVHSTRPEYGSRMVDTYIPPRSPPAGHRRWDSPPANAPTQPRQVPAGPSNYAARQPTDGRPAYPPSTSESRRSPPHPAGPSSSNAGSSSIGVTPIVPMKFKPKLPKVKPPASSTSVSTIASVPAPASKPVLTLTAAPIRHTASKFVPIPQSELPSRPSVISHEEAAINGDSNESARKQASKKAMPAFAMDEKEEIEMDVKPDISVVESQAATLGQQDGNTIDDNRNDGVLAWT